MNLVKLKKVEMQNKNCMNTKHGYNFGTKKFVHKRMTHMTSCVFNWNSSEKKSKRND